MCYVKKWLFCFEIHKKMGLSISTVTNFLPCGFKKYPNLTNMTSDFFSPKPVFAFHQPKTLPERIKSYIDGYILPKQLKPKKLFCLTKKYQIKFYLAIMVCAQ